MSQPFLSEIKIFSFSFAPQGWAKCDGQLLPINQNQALFALLGTTYGGNGQQNFALPNLRGRIPIHMGNGHTLGEAAGSTAVTLSISQLPQHLHFVTPAANANNNASAVDPANNFWANSGKTTFTLDPPTGTMLPAALANTGGSQAHNNMAPYLVLNFCIALQGIFPSQN